MRTRPRKKATPKKRAAKGRPLLSTQAPSSWKGTVHEWRMAKRGEWATVMRALDVFMYGSAYVPAGDDFYQLQRAAARIEKALSEDWVFV